MDRLMRRKISVNGCLQSLVSASHLENTNGAHIQCSKKRKEKKIINTSNALYLGVLEVGYDFGVG